MVPEQYEFESYGEGFSRLCAMGFRTINGSGDEYIFPSKPYLKGLPEAVPASCIPWPVGELKPNGIFIFDDSTNPAVVAYKSRIRKGLGIEDKVPVE